ncbi:MAG TPA: TonB-dependent receptor [Sphingomonas sp.]|nr:TonB-dependent receptor [Sphingomonas sp.]
MHSPRTLLALAVSSLALIQAQAAFAQQTAEAAPAAAPAEVPQDVVVTGTRTVGRSRLDSVAPVDVLSAASLQRQGTTELGAALAAVVPSIDFPRSSAVDGTDSIRPATLRGLSPDQTLVLINGVRAHTSALLNVNGSVGRGAAAVDLNTIPSVALDRIEVLRDGAAAQYGSDAIAGVVNLRLREARSGGGATVSFGKYITDVDTARGSRTEHDGDTVTVSGWQGLALGSDGFLTLSGEYLDRNPTSRGDFDPRKTPIRVRSRFGDPDVKQVSFYANAGKPIGGGWELYGFGGWQHRDSTSAATPRIVGGTGSSQNLSADALASFYPDGFTPLIQVKSTDLTATGGLRGDVSGWKVDLNLSYGRNKLTFFTKNSGNATYGSGSQTSFYDGTLAYDQLVSGLDVSRELPLGGGTINVAGGVEYRREGFQIGAGEHSSWDRGPLSANTALGSGAQGFPGFQPSNVVDVHRSNVSGYLDLEAKPVDGLTLGAAARGEHYSDFGDTLNGKLSARYDFAPWFALRGTASTGFRAPSLQQQYFTSTASVLGTNGNIVETGTFPSISPVGTALGGKPLRPEKATNFSAGAVLRSGGFDLSVDAYQIRIRDQIALSENLSGAAVTQTLLNNGIGSVTAGRFFLNGIRSRTKGIDVVAHYRTKSDNIGTFDFTAAANLNDVKVTAAPAPVTITAVVPNTGGTTVSQTLPIFSRQRIISFEQGTPRTKLVGTIDWSLDKFGVTARGSYYGDVTQPSSTGFAEDDIHTGRHTIFDLEARYQFVHNVNLAIGANNLFDTYPDAVPLTSSRGTTLNSTGLVGFPYYSPFGFNGRFIYGRIGVKW